MGERKPLPFGAGLDRISGGMVLQPTDMNDLRNVHLNHGRTEFRHGLTRTLLFPAPYTDLLGVYLIRAQGLAGALLYDSVSRRVDLYAVDSSGVASAYIDNIWTLPAGATSPPRISAADSYDQLVIAHDEPIYPLRQATTVYSAVDSTVGPLMLDLGRTGTPEGARFRGVAKHLAYIVGYGYGTNQPGQGDRGEVLRISMPGEPTNFIPEHYFLVGTQGDPIIACGPVAGELAVQKIASSYKLVGYDRQSFGVRRLDPSYGAASSRLGAAVNDEWFFWSLSGPRSSVGGPSSDLGLPLALDGPVPDALASATPQEMGFAYYDPTEREVVFCFGQWAYVLHLKDGDRRWSYRQFAVALNNAGLLYIGGTLGLTNIVAHPEPGALTYTEPTYAGADVNPKITVPWNVVGGAVTTEQIEIWVKSRAPGGAWKRKYVGAASGASAVITLTDFQTIHDVAMRFASGGFAGSGYTSADPSLWPAVSRTTIQTLGTISAYAIGKWKRYTSTVQGYDTTSFAGPMLGQVTPGAGSYRVEKSTDNITFVALASGLTAAQVASAIRLPNSDTFTIGYYRVRFEGTSGNSAWMVVGPKTVAPEPPTTLTITGNLTGPANNTPDNHDLTWAAPAAVNGEVPADGPYEVRGRHTDAPASANVGPFGSTSSLAAGVHALTGLTFPGFTNNTTVHRTGEGQVRIVLASGDSSPYVLITTYEP